MLGCSIGNDGLVPSALTSMDTLGRGDGSLASAISGRGRGIVGDVLTQPCALREESITHSLGFLQCLGVLPSMDTLRCEVALARFQPKVMRMRKQS